MSNEINLGEFLRAATVKLGEVSESPRLDAEIMLARAINMPRSYIFAHPEDTLDERTIGRFERNLSRRLDGEPMAYITGSREFWSLELMVTPATLVPRPETELLVELALREIPQQSAWTVLDLGTGSGAVALALGKERPLCNIAATDQSTEALRVARQNARQLDLDNIEFIDGSWFSPLAGRKFDLIVSNPPYVREADPALDKLTHEPRAALVSGHDGLDAIRHLAAHSRAHLKPGGPLIIEHGAEQQTEVAAILAAAGWAAIECTRDTAGLPRVTSARMPAFTGDL